MLSDVGGGSVFAGNVNDGVNDGEMDHTHATQLYVASCVMTWFCVLAGAVCLMCSE